MTSYIEKLEKLRIPNPTLRDCFDPSSHEFSETTMQHKIETLQKIISTIFHYYKSLRIIVNSTKPF